MKPNERPQYISQINAFHRFAGAYFLSTNAQLLWFKLIDLCNTCGWPEWVQADAQNLMFRIGARDVRAVYRARDALVKAGLLEYRKGHKGCPNRYRLIFFPCKTDRDSDSINDSISDSIYGTQNGL